MPKYKYEGYTLTLFDTGKRDGYNKHVIAYKLEDRDGIIFQGHDFFSPDGYPTNKTNAGALMSFLILRKDDVEDDYFDNYTERQLRFRDDEAEDLFVWVEELEGTLEEQ